MALLDDDGRKMMRAAAQTSAIGIEIVICILMGFFGGRWLDGRFDTGPYLTIFCGLLGLGAAVKVIHRLITRTDLDKM